jgi:hypothetical protein
MASYQKIKPKQNSNPTPLEERILNPFSSPPIWMDDEGLATPASRPGSGGSSPRGKISNYKTPRNQAEKEWARSQGLDTASMGFDVEIGVGEAPGVSSGVGVAVEGVGGFSSNLLAIASKNLGVIDRMGRVTKQSNIEYQLGCANTFPELSSKEPNPDVTPKILEKVAVASKLNSDESTPTTPKSESKIPFSGSAEQEAFLSAFRNSGNIRASCKDAGVSRSMVEYWKKTDEEFKDALASAQADAVDVVAAEVLRRALTGSDILLMFLAKKLDPSFRDNAKWQIQGDGSNQPTEVRLVYGAAKKEE